LGFRKILIGVLQAAIDHLLFPSCSSFCFCWFFYSRSVLIPFLFLSNLYLFVCRFVDLGLRRYSGTMVLITKLYEQMVLSYWLLYHIFLLRDNAGRLEDLVYCCR
jgi:hypothetical protein